jgi:hypothetical protein
MNVQSAAPRGLDSDVTPRLSEIPGVKAAGDAFMKAIFNEMQVGDVRVVPNFGESIFYVVKVKTRHPEDEAEKEGFRARFLKERLFGGNSFMGGGQSTYDYLAVPEQQRIGSEWVKRLEAKYNLKKDLEERRSRGRTPPS